MQTNKSQFFDRHYSNPQTENTGKGNGHFFGENVFDSTIWQGPNEWLT